VTANDLVYASATELRQRYERRDLSPVEATEAILARIERLNPELMAYVTVTADLAREQAKAAEQAYASGEPGLLAGIPLSIKDLTPTKGIRTTRGSLLYADWVPDYDPPFMERVYAAGAVTLGKTNTPEFGWKGESTNRVFGSTRNPWNLERTAGGSSGGGAAAVAAGLGPIAQGSDGAGSIRMPCGFCGIFGLKPTFGAIPQYPVSALVDLSHIGPMTRTVADAALMMNATAGFDPRDRQSRRDNIDYLAALDNLDLKGLKAAWSPDLGYAGVEPDAREAAEAAAKKLADLGVEIAEDHPDLGDPWPIVDALWAPAMAAINAENFEQVRDQLDPGRVAVMDSAARFSGIDVSAAHLKRMAYYHAWSEFMKNYDLMLTPTLPIGAFPAGQDQPGSVNGVPTHYLSWSAFTYPFNLTGQPAATVPCGFDHDGLPLGLQIVGRFGDDATVLRAAAAFEAAEPWAQLTPPLD
jgi:aspartyl-tRNA(Asn)/glutamyl-tRNA(Gln) amidotransferase subunit A